MRTLLVLLSLAVSLPAAADITPIVGSYGRVGFSVDEDGGKASKRQITLFGPRLSQGNYLELDLGASLRGDELAKVKVLTTLSIGDRFAHESGDFDAGVAVRQAFVEAEALWGSGAFVWLGSRMARGDDIYLLDFWPVDNLNIVGAAGGWRTSKSDSQLIFGLNRAIDGYQVQYVDVPSIEFGEASIPALNRQRSILAASHEHRFGGEGDALGAKVKVYSELHLLPKGRRALSASYEEDEPLPDDRGWLVGAQFGLWNFGPNSHVNLWVRYANGMAAFDELQQPVGLNRDRRADGADELRVALSGNAQRGKFGAMFGSYYRYFRDADPNEVDYDDGQEFVAAVRPMYFAGLFTPAVEASIQLRRANGINPRTNTQAMARVIQIAALPALTLSRSNWAYGRPQIRLIAAADFMNDAARAQFPELDPRARHSVSWFAGARAEWWFGRGGGY